MDELIQAIETNLTADELTRVLVVAQYALFHPQLREKVMFWTGLSKDDCLALAHNVTEIVGKE